MLTLCMREKETKSLELRGQNLQPSTEAQWCCLAGWDPTLQLHWKLTLTPTIWPPLPHVFGLARPQHVWYRHKRQYKRKTASSFKSVVSPKILNIFIPLIEKFVWLWNCLKSLVRWVSRGETKSDPLKSSDTDRDTDHTMKNLFKQFQSQRQTFCKCNKIF